MFDLGLAKLALIGVVALIVLGPQRLPRVARTAGTLLGRAQRYISEVKAESVLPVWYKRTARKRVHVQSAAARMQFSRVIDMRAIDVKQNIAWAYAGFMRWAALQYAGNDGARLTL
ncbi:hypothetical protein BGZ96_007255 [Linnemannia gamsii]|uniref:Sec-independent protein translocase protein TatB n=1 Tax=Linnemannia gamsii TaxID=64522 RepID=A0ABQ7K1W7_9FUNG|nr:hypothetical protein BGZ96_007255 [Linnemannia gamsii]